MINPTHHPLPRRPGRPPVNTGPCSNCHSPRAAVRGLCKPCDAYLKNNGVSRPMKLEVKLSAKRGVKIGRCLCGEYATMKIKTNLGKMELCPACAALEARQAAGVWEVA